MIRRHLLPAVLVFAFFLSGCKGYKEFRQARKELKVEKAERRENRDTVNAEAESSQAETSSNAGNAEQFTDSLFFAMRRTPCFGTCPTFELKIYKSGLAAYHGQAHVYYIGEFETRFEPAALDSIKAKAERMGYMMLLDSYNNSMISDLPSAIYTFNFSGQKKEILCRVGCPDRLVQFGKEMDDLIESVDWGNQR